MDSSCLVKRYVNEIGKELGHHKEEKLLKINSTICNTISFPRGLRQSDY